MKNLKHYENFNLNGKSDADNQNESATKDFHHDEIEKGMREDGLVDALKEYKDAAKNLVKISKKLDKFKKGKNDGRGLIAKISATQDRADEVLRIFNNHFGDIV